MITKNQLIKQYIADKVGATKAGRSTSNRATPAYMAGKRDGHRVDMNFKGVPNTPKQLR